MAQSCPTSPDRTTVDNSADEVTDLGFGDFRLLYYRAIQRSGLSQTAIAKAIGYDNQGFLSLMLNGKATVPPERLKEWLAPLKLSDREFALLYRKGLEEFAPDYVRELISNFARAYQHILRGDTMPPLNGVLAGKIKRR